MASDEIAEILEQLNNVHYPSGPNKQKIERFKASQCLKSDELETVYHLVESHVPSLRLKTVLRYEKILTSKSDNPQKTLSKNNVALNCIDSKLANNTKELIDKVKEMPPEWTMVQLTPFFNTKENMRWDLDEHFTNSLFVSVFNCGQDAIKPFCVEIQAPKEKASGSLINLVEEMHSIVKDNRSALTTLPKGQTHFRDGPEKLGYFAKRRSVDDRLKLLIKDLQNLYLREWRCLLMGKYVNKDVDLKIRRKLSDFFKGGDFYLEDRALNLLHYLVKGAICLQATELKGAIKQIIPNHDKQFQTSLAQFVQSISTSLSVTEQRHPLILIVDDSLDCFPWEMIDVLIDVPVSRVPSLHLAYALFKEHKSSIKNGFKTIENPQNGTYIINPDLDLLNMQNRICTFLEYWTPKWKGIAGVKPTEEQFEQMLVTSDIFSYNGHGNGAHYFSMQKIERVRINAVVLLFGCGSVRLSELGPQTEMYGTFQMYLVACSPCIVGMLWEVTDVDTDILTTEFLSHWIPNNKRSHWKYLDKSKWKRGEKVDFREVNLGDRDSPHQPDLLRALSSAKKSSMLSFYITKAACVARGIPVKIAST